MKSKFQTRRSPTAPSSATSRRRTCSARSGSRCRANGQEVGTLNAENWRAWNFNIQDASGTEVARITKTWEGLAKTVFTTADNYVVEFTAAIEEPLRSLVVAAALCVDTALKQDESRPQLTPRPSPDARLHSGGGRNRTHRTGMHPSHSC